MTMRTEKQLWATYRLARSIRTRNALVEYYYPILPRLIGKFCPRRTGMFVTDEDISAASVGLLRAIEKYKDGTGALFTTYLHNAVIRHVFEDRQQQYLIQTNRVGCANDAIPVPLDESMPAEPIAQGADRDEDTRSMCEMVLRTGRTIDLLLRTLTPQERKVVKLIHYEGMASTEVAKKMKITRGRVSQIRSKAFAKLKRIVLPD